MKPWLAHYDPDVRQSIAPYPDKTLVDYLDGLARDHANDAALLFKGSTMSYGQLDRESTAFAAALASLGVGKGDRVAVLLPNCPQFLVAEFGIWKAGGVVVAVNPTYSEREIEQVLDSTQAQTVVTLTPFYKRIKAVQGRTGVKRVIATSIKEYFPSVLRLLFTLFKEKKEGHRITLAGDDFWFQSLIESHRRAPRPGVTVGPGDRAVILSSGGTTGTPKGVVGLHRHYVAAGLQLYEWTKSAKQPWTDVIMLPLPLFHVYANVGVQPLAFVGPNPLSLIPNPRDIGDVLKTIKQVKPAFFNGVPTLYNAMLNHPDVRAGKVDLRSIRLCICGASALLAETRRQFEQQTGAVMLEGYSLTEAMMACCLNPVQGKSKVGSIGLPVCDVEARIVDVEDGATQMPTGEVGELIMRAPQLMLEYWNNPLETAETLRTYDSGGPWLHTGDLAYMDGDGYIFIVDRKKDMMKTSGFQVWPREIEEVIAAHPAVHEVGVAGIPDPVKGEVAKAWVV
jgi:long-chain acyl-CoA synthetase